MKQFIKKLLIEGLLNENTLYGKNIIDAITNRIADKSDDTLNKLAIAGLYRNVFGDVQQLKTKEQLDNVFNKWYQQTITNLTKTPSFIDNKPLATKYLDAYIKNIKSLGSNAKPFSFKKVEQGLVDLVNNNRWIEDDSIKQGNDIYNPRSEDVVYEDENVIILDTNTKAKCVMYGQGESWCITKPELNYYNTYRINYGATPYFVLQKNEQKPKNKVVIMHYESGYAVADQTNSGDMAGGNARDNHPWSWVESKVPNLRGLEKYFPYRKITEDERKYEKILQETKSYQGDNLQGYIDHAIKGLVINGSQVEAVDFIRDYAATGVRIDDDKLRSLRPEVMDSLIEGGYFISNGQKQEHLLNDKQALRVIRLKVQNKKVLSYNNLLRLPESEGDDYISNLDSSGIGKLLDYTPEENRLELINRIFPLVKDKLDSSMVGGLIYDTPEENRLELINRIFPLVKDKLDSNMVYELLNYTPVEHRVEMINRILPLVKDKLDGYMVNGLLNYTPREHRVELVKQILPLVKDKLDSSMVGKLLDYTPVEHREYVQGLINQERGVNENILRIKQLLK